MAWNVPTASPRTGRRARPHAVSYTHLDVYKRQAYDFYTTRGWCTSSKKLMLCKMHKSYRAKNRNHLSEHFEQEILDLPDKPKKKESEEIP